MLRKLRLHQKALASWKAIRTIALSSAAPKATKHSQEATLHHGLFRIHETIKPTTGKTIDCVAFNATQFQLWVEDFALARRWHGPVFDTTNTLSEHETSHPFIQSKVAVKISERQSLQLLYLPKLNSFVGYSDDDNTIRLFDSNLQIIGKTTTASPATCACVNTENGDIIFGCEGMIATYALRRGKVFYRRSSIEDPIPPAQIIRSITVEVAPSTKQRIFASYGTNIIIFHVSGAHLYTIPDAHTRPISKILYSDETNCLISGSRDGSIKLWDSAWNLIHLFAGHIREVTCMVKHSIPTLFVSTSLDGSIRIWNLLTLEPEEHVTTGEPYDGVGFLASPYRFYTYSKDEVVFWQLRHIRNDFAIIGESVISMQKSVAGIVPSRIVALSVDSSVRLVSPVTGAIITTIPPDPRLKYDVSKFKSVIALLSSQADDAALARSIVVQVVFSSELNRIFCLMKDGSIRIYDARQNPCNLLRTWTDSCTPDKRVTLIQLAEFAFDGETDEQLTEQKNWSGLVNRVVAKGDRVVVMIGATQDGYLVRYDIELGTRMFSVATETRSRVSQVAFILNILNLIPCIGCFLW